MARRDQIFHNPGLKLFSIGLACTLWFAVHERNPSALSAGDPTGPVVTKEYVRLPITALQPPGETHAFKLQPATVSVNVSGHQAQLQELRGSDLEVFVNLADVGDRPATTRTVKVLVPPGVTLVRVIPTVVRIERLPPSSPPPQQP